jgi:hypothetical protein
VVAILLRYEQWQKPPDSIYRQLPGLPFGSRLYRRRIAGPDTDPGVFLG